MGEIAIRAENLSKAYKIGSARQRPGSLRELLAGGPRAIGASLGLRRPGRDDETFWALNDVTFEVRRGEIVGLVGSNGAGKSTLLKILSRITRPTTGAARIRGRVGTLLEVGTGFHPELTGRENIYLNGAILGMSRSAIRRRFDEIVAFAEVERFLDTPVKRYSSGMYVRLAFAVAAHLEPEILVVDEVISVGDANFQKRCLNKMNDVAGDGRTVLFVSHNLGAIQTLCQTGLLLVRGQLRRWGPIRDVVAEHLASSDATATTPIAERTDRGGEGRFRFLGLETLDARGRPADFVQTGEDMSFRIKLETPRFGGELPVPLDIEIHIRDPHGNRVTTLGSSFAGGSPTSIEGACEVTCFVPRLPLLAEQYRLDLWCAVSETTQDVLKNAAILRVEPGNYFGNTADLRLPQARHHGCCMIPQSWRDATSRGTSWDDASHLVAPG